VVFEKQSNDVATNKHFAEAIWYLKSQQGITNVVVYGVATDYCVKDAVKAFQDNGFGVFVVRDAIAGISQDNSNKALDDFVAHDARLISSLDILRRDHG
jgi:nicotinamidase/pyrazinamidase